MLSLSFAATQSWSFTTTDTTGLGTVTVPNPIPVFGVLNPLGGSTTNNVATTATATNPVLQVACLDDAAQAEAIKQLCMTQGIQVPCPRIFYDTQNIGTATYYARQYKFNISHGQRLLRVATFPYVSNDSARLSYNSFNESDVVWSGFRDFLGQIPLMDSTLTSDETFKQLIKPLFQHTIHGKSDIWKQQPSIVRDFTGGWDLVQGCPAAGVDLSAPLDYEVQLTGPATARSMLVVWLGQNVFRVGPTGVSLLPA
jgi:hypothetical protein